MAVALEQFVKQLEDSGIVAPGRLEKFLPPKADPKTAEELARQLVRQKDLTKFQAQEIYLGRARALILGHYTILDRIGAGGMGQVFKALHHRMERVVAIKTLPAKTMKDASAVARFQREVKAAAKLRHSNIVAADDADEANGIHFLVMEYVEGNDLSALVKKNGALSVGTAVDYILQAARGLEFAHGEGVVHRDIKPANLLVDKKGVVKILDMGLARIESSGNAAIEAELTGTGAVMGTVDYMAPEQALNTKTADARADIYSLGCTLFYLLTAKATYDGDSLMAKLMAHKDNPIPSLRDVQPQVSEQLEAVFRKMVAKKVEDRYQSMSEVLADLEKCRGGSQASVVTDHSLGLTNNDAGLMTFLKDIPAPTVHTKQKVKATVAPKAGGGQKRLLWIVGGAVLGLAILAGIIVSLRTKDGTLIVEVDQPDAMVQVLDAEGKVEVSQKGAGGKITIGVDAGKHRLKVEKDGFVVFGQDFEIETGGRKSITAKLVPVASGTVVAAQTFPPSNSDNPIATLSDPAFQQWMKDVAAMSAREQMDAVAAKLKKLNPGFDGRVRGGSGESWPKIENEVVTGFGFTSGNVTNISPVRALVGLRNLDCSSNSSLSDLSPLQGMSLVSVKCDRTNVSDLSPLKAMPLTSLICDRTKVTDLSPLEGMPLTNLDFTFTGASNLPTLRGKTLTTLAFGNTRVTDLSPLKGMPLTTLNCSGSKIFDLSPLLGMQLENLNCGTTPVLDLLPLKGMPLTKLVCVSTEVSDLTPLQDCRRLVSLDVRKTKVAASGVASLQNVLPNCKIEWDDPAKATTPLPSGTK